MSNYPNVMISKGESIACRHPICTVLLGLGVTAIRTALLIGAGGMDGKDGTGDSKNGLFATKMFV